MGSGNQQSSLDNNSDRRFKCNQCGLMYARIQNLERHKLVHLKHKPFSCSICSHGFTDKYNMVAHEKRHSEKRPLFKCGICRKVFLNKCSLTEHTKRHQGIERERKYTCTFCGEKKCTSTELEVHVRSHTNEKPFHCSICGNSFTSRPVLQTHLRTHDPGAKKYQCPSCPKLLSNKSSLAVHISEIHNKHSKRKYICPIDQCGFETYRPKSFATHKKVKHLKQYDFLCPQCPKMFGTRDSRRTHIRLFHINKGVLHYCSICSKGFTTKSTLKAHVFTHSGQTPFSCEVCGNKFKSANGKRLHLQSQHQIGKVRKVHNCYFCEKHYTTGGGLSYHIGIHTLELPYECVQPGCKIPRHRTAAFLLRHLTKHHGIGAPRPRPRGHFKCQFPQCSKIYNLRCSLRKHVRAQHEQTDLIFICPHCPKQCGTSRGLAYHLKSHSDNRITFPCDICDKTFLSSAGWQHHMNRHRGIHREKKHECKLCGDKLMTVPLLEAHVRAHILERPFKCETCNKTFLSKYGLTSHERIHQNRENVQCPKCSKVFKSPSSMYYHVKFAHTTNKIVQCYFCQKSYHSFHSRDFQTHFRTHTCEQPYGCGIDGCRLKFKTSDTVKKHRFAKHKFGNPPAPRKHGIFPCSKCNKIFSLNNVLMRHVKDLHDETGPIIRCYKCDYQTRSKGAYQAHFKRMHDKVGSVYRCEPCGYETRIRGNYKRHEKNVHRKG